MATVAGEIRGSAPPWNSVKDEIAKAGGIEAEFLFGGTATEYRLTGGASYSLDGRWDVEPKEQADFRSRMLVLRPERPSAFNGTVFAVWNNVSSGRDSITSLDLPRMVREGFAVVGITTQFVGVEGQKAPRPEVDLRSLPGREHIDAFPDSTGLKEHDPERYGSLVHPGDGFSFDIFTQAGQLIGPGRPSELDPLGGLDVRHVIASGGSQAGCRLATYINAVQPAAGLYDAFLVRIYAGCPTVVDPETAPENLPQIPNNSVGLLPWGTYRLRDNLDIPIIVLNSEYEVDQYHPNNQPDTDTLRFWEFPGTAHLGGRTREELDTETNTGNRVSFAPATRAAIYDLRRWLNGGSSPPHQPRLTKVGSPPAFQRDEHGNAIGGIRLPELEAPLATHIGESTDGADGYTRLFGSTTPFPPEKVRALYPSKEVWFARYKAAVEHLVSAEVFLADDAEQLINHASTTELPL
jgi:hypothetical protein